ncbi:hypothetical protein MMC18_009596 [Xylographa bjoerkii]|nr:hypothetical protein [Xylographa bjoerkii]
MVSDSSSVDVLIVGGGPSGLSAALCLSRARYTTAIFDSSVYRNAESWHMHMVPTWDHKDPREYRAAARKELQTRYHTTTFVDKAVISVIKTSAGGFEATDADGKVWSGKKLILAVGVKDILPDIPGYKECWVKGMYVSPPFSPRGFSLRNHSFHCLFCHGYEERDVNSVGVLAVDLMAQMPPIANGLARNALQFTKDVTVYTNGSEEVANTLAPMVQKKGIKVDSRKIARLVKLDSGSDVKIEFADGSEVTHGFLVHGPRNEIDLSFAKGLKLEVSPSGGELKVVNPFQETTEPGCFAIGDVGSIGKIAVAGVAFGTFAATGVVKQLQAD